MRSLIVANWKCNPQTIAEAKQLFDLVKKGLQPKDGSSRCAGNSRVPTRRPSAKGWPLKNIKNAEVVICPPFVYLSSFAKSYGGLLALGSQDCFWEEKGAYTGEISPLMLKNLGVEYVILGHSERRKYLGETNEMINKKIKKVLELKLKPILCIGETGEEREKEKKAQIIESQIKEGLKGVLKKEIGNLIIAYEPIWAIGTGKNCSVNETMSSTIFIRKVISRLYGRRVSEKLRILYGWSVNSENAAAYIKEANTCGLLVGGASLDAKEFVKIIKSSWHFFKNL